MFGHPSASAHDIIAFLCRYLHQRRGAKTPSASSVCSFPSIVSSFARKMNFDSPHGWGSETQRQLQLSDKHELRFAPDGTFQITVFSDLHFAEGMFPSARSDSPES